MLKTCGAVVASVVIATNMFSGVTLAENKIDHCKLSKLQIENFNNLFNVDIKLTEENCKLFMGYVSKLIFVGEARGYNSGSLAEMENCKKTISKLNVYCDREENRNNEINFELEKRINELESRERLMNSEKMSDIIIGR